VVVVVVKGKREKKLETRGPRLNHLLSKRDLWKEYSQALVNS
jgi:hypothetical protein